MNSTAINVNSVSKTFKVPSERKMRLKDYFLNPFSRTKLNKYNALQNINFEINKGEFVGIIGRNGSGKSTLLKILAGVYTPTGGELNIEGKIIPFLELGVGFNPELTGRENIFLNGTILGMTKKEIKAKMDEIIKFSEIGDFIDMQLKHYSSGMVVRLAFAIAIQSQGDIFLLDEVMAVGDAGFQVKSQQEILKLKKQGKTIVFVSHDHGSIQKYADKVIWIKDSHVEEIATGQKNISTVLKKYLKTFNYQVTDLEKDESENVENKVDINEVDIFNKDNEISKNFYTGEPMSVKVKYEIKDRKIVDDIIFGISVTNDTGIVVYGTNSYMKEISKMPEKGTVNFEINKLNLLSGTYFVTIGVHSKAGENYYWDDKGFSFNIVSEQSEVGIADLDVSINIE